MRRSDNCSGAPRRLPAAEAAPAGFGRNPAGICGPGGKRIFLLWVCLAGLLISWGWTGMVGPVLGQEYNGSAFISEIFSNNDNDLEYRTLIFTPDDLTGNYNVCMHESVAFFSDPAGETRISLTDDDSEEIFLSTEAKIMFFGIEFSSFFVGSNGYITFNQGDTGYSESWPEHFSQVRISAFFDDLNPGSGGEVSWKQLPDRAVITFQNVPEYRNTGSNSFQIEMFYSGVVRITYLEIDAADGLVGLSDGNGVPDGFVETDLTSLQCIDVALPHGVSENENTAVGTITIPISFERDIVISLAADNASLVELPISEILIEKGDTSADFSIILKDNNLLDGTKEVTIKATAEGFGFGEFLLRIHDNERTDIHLAIPLQAEEGAGLLLQPGIVTLDTAPDEDVSITLTASNDEKVSIPYYVTVPSGQTEAQFNIEVLDNAVVDGDQLITINAEVTGWQSGSANMQVFDDDFFVLTEIFTDQDNDLDYKSITFTPDGSENFYAVCVDEADAFPVDPEGGISLFLWNNDYNEIHLHEASVNFFGGFYSSLFVGSNGYISFGNGDHDQSESFYDHYRMPRISALFDDLNPRSRGKISWKQLSDRAVITFQNVPEFETLNSNSFQIEIFYCGVVRITYLEIDASDGMVGLSDGNGMLDGAVEKDFTSLQCISVDLPDEVMENAGTIEGIVSIPTPLQSNLIVNLVTYDDLLLVDLPVTLIAGFTSASFRANVSDDQLLNGSRDVMITASADGFNDKAFFLRIHDNETAELTVSLPESADETLGQVIGSVTVNPPVNRDVNILLSSSDATEIIVPGVITILSGENSAEFLLTIVDDNQLDGPVTATVTASVLNWTPGNDTITITDNEIYGYTEDFSGDYPADGDGWTYYSSTPFGRIEVVGGRLRMDVSSSPNYTLNETILSVNLENTQDVVLNFFQAEFDDENEAIPGVFEGHYLGDGVSVSNNGTTWYRIVDASDLDTGSTGNTFSIDLDAAIARIQADYDPFFEYRSDFKIKFQQYDDHSYTTDGREWDDISLTMSSTVALTVSLPEVIMEKNQVLEDQGRITISQPQSEEQVITLISDDTNSIRIPQSVILPPDQSLVTFDLEVIDDTIVNGHRDITVTASLPNWTIATGRTSLVVIDDETAAVAFEDNEDNSGTGSADADMGRDAMVCVANTDAVHPIEFGIEVKGDPPVSDAFLLLTVDEAVQPERSEVFLNGHSLGMILGGSPKKAHHWLLIPDPSWVETGTNRIRIEADLDNRGDCLTVYGGQFVFDGASSGIASIRTAESDADFYAYGDSVRVTVEADTILHAMNVRMALTLLDSTGAVLGVDTDPGILSRPISLNQNEPHQLTFTLPNTGADGIWGVAVGLYHANTGLFLDSAFIPFKVPSAVAAAPFVDTVFPDALIAGEENNIVIRGGNFLPEDTQCSIGDYPLGMQAVFGTTLITGIVTDQLDPGQYTLQCTTSEGTAAEPVPVISGLPVISDIRIGTADLVNDFENGYVLFGDQILTFTVTSTSGIETVEVLIDGAAEAIQPDTDSDYSFPLTPLSGAHRLEIHATDSFGRQTAAAFDIAREMPLPFACFQECIQ